MTRTRQSSHLRRIAKQLAETARTVADAARTDSAADAAQINVEQRTNLVVATQIGEPGTTTVATQRQHAPIRQGRAAGARTKGPKS